MALQTNIDWLIKLEVLRLYNGDVYHWKLNSPRFSRLHRWRQFNGVELKAGLGWPSVHNYLSHWSSSQNCCLWLYHSYEILPQRSMECHWLRCSCHWYYFIDTRLAELEIFTNPSNLSSLEKYQCCSFNKKTCGDPFDVSSLNGLSR